MTRAEKNKMPKRRYVLPDFFEDEKMGSLPADARLLYISMWCYADDKGRAKGGAAAMKSWCYLYDDSTGIKRVRELIALLEQEGRIVTYEVNGESFYVVPRLPNHQWIVNASASKLPKPPRDKLEALGLDKNAIDELIDDRPWKKQNGVSTNPDKSGALEADNSALAIFEYWKKVNGIRRGVLNSTRQSHILARQKEGYSISQIKRAIIGNRISDWHQKNGHYDIELICRNAVKMDYYIGLYREWVENTGGYEESILFSEPEKSMFDRHSDSDELDNLGGDLFDKI
jgi:hypothetical protein